MDISFSCFDELRQAHAHIATTCNFTVRIELVRARCLSQNRGLELTCDLQSGTSQNFVPESS